MMRTEPVQTVVFGGRLPHTSTSTLELYPRPGGAEHAKERHPALHGIPSRVPNPRESKRRLLEGGFLVSHSALRVNRVCWPRAVLPCDVSADLARSLVLRANATARPQLEDLSMYCVIVVT